MDSQRGMKEWEISELNESMRDVLHHRNMPQELVDMYMQALQELFKEGNPRAKVVMDMFETREDRGFIDAVLNQREWAFNIHHNTWGETSFAGVIKARVLVLRIQRGQQNGAKT